MISTVNKNNKFFLEPITAGDILQQTKRLDINDASEESDTPTKLVKHFDNLIVNYLQENLNKDFKKAVVYPTYKNDSQSEKSNNRPMSILPNLSRAAFI